MSLKNIIICGDSRDKKLTDTIISVCKKVGGVFVSDGECIYTTSKNPLFCITCTDRIRMIDADGIIIFGDGYTEPDEKCTIKRAVCITDSSNKAAVRSLNSTESCVIGCSMSERDTLSISCITDEYRLVSLQRNIHTLDGDIIEPCEIKLFSDRDLSPFTVLAVCAVLLLTGQPYDDGFYI